MAAKKTDAFGNELVPCICGKEARLVICGVGSYVRCVWCDRGTYMCTTSEDTMRMWREMAAEETVAKEENKVAEEREIKYIKTEQIYPHPENPRKNLGDLDELTESIRKNGIMQNLTVIPGHWLTDGEWQELTKQYREAPSEEVKEQLNGGWKPDGYTLIIGHRRHAAARLAGITELPCRVVSGMDRREQLSVMLEENMQRNDLTIYEQAQGFQLMLDLGETEDTIAEKTGFSKTTVRHRLNIAKLDQDIVKEKEKDDYFQLSLKDLYALEKVPDIGKRNEILRNASDSRNLAWRAQAAAGEIRRDKAAEAIVGKLVKLGIKQAPKKAADEQWFGKWDKVKEFDLDEPVPENITFRGKVKEMFYLRYCQSIRVIRKAVKKEKALTPYELERREIDGKRKEMGVKQKALAGSVSNFILAIVEGKVEPVKTDLGLVERIWRVLINNYSFMSRDRVIAFVGGKHSYELTKEEIADAEQKISRMSVVHQMLAMIPDNINIDLANYSGKFILKNGRKCKALIELLKPWGFSVTEEQEQMLDGTHELYVKEENKNGGEAQ